VAARGFSPRTRRGGNRGAPAAAFANASRDGNSAKAALADFDAKARKVVLLAETINANIETVKAQQEQAAAEEQRKADEAAAKAREEQAEADAKARSRGRRQTGRSRSGPRSARAGRRR
jgi:hypothetical protein